MAPPAIPPFEWDEAKRQRTVAERGVDFAAFVVFWDGRPLEDRQDLRHAAERRYVRFARLDGGRLGVAVWTQRGGTVRLISVRKANAREERKFGPKIPPARRVGEPRRIGGFMDEITYDPATFDWTRFDATTDEDIARQIAEDPDTAPDLVEAEEQRWIVPVEPVTPPAVGIRPDVLAWYQAQGPGYTARINAVLEAYMRDAMSRTR